MSSFQIETSRQSYSINSNFCVAVAGFRTPGELASTIFESGYSTPTLHVLGKNDIIVVEERARTLLDVSNVKRVVEHDGG